MKGHPMTTTDRYADVLDLYRDTDSWSRRSAIADVLDLIYPTWRDDHPDLTAPAPPVNDGYVLPGLWIVHGMYVHVEHGEQITVDDLIARAEQSTDAAVLVPEKCGDREPWQLKIYATLTERLAAWDPVERAPEPAAETTQPPRPRFKRTTAGSWGDLLRVKP